MLYTFSDEEFETKLKEIEGAQIFRRDEQQNLSIVTEV